jgi:outer membrane protein
MREIAFRAILSLALLFLASAALAQGKIGTIDMRKVFDDYHKTRTADAELKDRAAELDKERKLLVDSYTKIKEEYDKALDSANDPIVSAEEREKRKKAAENRLLELRAKEQEIGVFDREARSNLDERQRRMRDKILEEIRSFITAKAKAEGFMLVLDTSSADPRMLPPVVLYSSGENDLTTAILNQLNLTAPPGYSPDKKKEEKK